MRPTLALLLLCLLPLQFAFAAGAEYCELGIAHKSQHFGHHVHKSGANHETSKSGKAKTSADRDCAFCQLGCAHAQVSSFHVLAAVPVASFARPQFALPPGIVHAPPDLPPRVALA